MTCAGPIGAELNLPLEMSEVDVGEVEAKIIGGELDFGIAFIPSPRPELEYLPLGSVVFNSFAREDLIQKSPTSEIPYAVPTSDFPSNPLGYKNRDGWPKDTPRRPFYSVSNFAVALSLLREGQAAVYMPEYVAAQENAYSAGALKIAKIKDHAKAETRRQLFLVKSLSSIESREMKKVSKVIRKHCCVPKNT
jgi:DNA-binding transcriptional LysR family regulator